MNRLSVPQAYDIKTVAGKVADKYYLEPQRRTESWLHRHAEFGPRPIEGVQVAGRLLPCTNVVIDPVLPRPIHRCHRFRSALQAWQSRSCRRPCYPSTISWCASAYQLRMKLP